MPVLILSPDPVAAALLGAYVESLDERVAFARSGEVHLDLLRRTRPRLVLLDCSLDRELCDSVLGPAKMLGSRVILFAPGELADVVRELGDRRGVESLVLPEDLARLGEMITSIPVRGSRQAL